MASHASSLTQVVGPGSEPVEFVEAVDVLELLFRHPLATEKSQKEMEEAGAEALGG